MYKELNQKEINRFIKRYFNAWKNDIKKVSVICYNGIDEYLINEHYLYVVGNQKNDIYFTSSFSKKWYDLIRIEKNKTFILSGN